MDHGSHDDTGVHQGLLGLADERTANWRGIEQNGGRRAKRPRLRQAAYAFRLDGQAALQRESGALPLRRSADGIASGSQIASGRTCLPQRATGHGRPVVRA